MSHVTPFPNALAPAATPEGLIDAVVHLVSTGAVPLGAYTLAELTVVDAVVDFLEERPSDEVLGEAVRSLAARQLLVATKDSADLQVRGDLGIALAFQQRARRVIDIRVTGTTPGEPWRILLLPQPERITLEFRIDALGVHEVGLYETEEAVERTAAWLPGGDPADPSRARHRRRARSRPPQRLADSGQLQRGGNGRAGGVGDGRGARAGGRRSAPVRARRCRPRRAGPTSRAPTGCRAAPQHHAARLSAPT